MQVLVGGCLVDNKNHHEHCSMNCCVKPLVFCVFACLALALSAGCKDQVLLHSHADTVHAAGC